MTFGYYLLFNHLFTEFYLQKSLVHLFHSILYCRKKCPERLVLRQCEMVCEQNYSVILEFWKKNLFLFLLLGWFFACLICLVFSVLIFECDILRRFLSYFCYFHLSRDSVLSRKNHMYLEQSLEDPKASEERFKSLFNVAR